MMYFIPLCLSSVIPLALKHHLILQYYQKNTFTAIDFLKFVFNVKFRLNYSVLC